MRSTLHLPDITCSREYAELVYGQQIDFDYDNLNIDFDDQDWLEYSLEFKYSNTDISVYAAVTDSVNFLGGL